MAEYVTVIRELQRMCDKNKCAECPITKTRHKCEGCNAWMNNYPEEVERIVMKWAAEHPIKTNGMMFKELFGFDLEYKFPVSEYARGWLNSEYINVNSEGKCDGNT